MKMELISFGAIFGHTKKIPKLTNNKYGIHHAYFDFRKGIGLSYRAVNTVTYHQNYIKNRIYLSHHGDNTTNNCCLRRHMVTFGIC